MITTNQLLQRLKLKNAKTLQRWQQFDLIPKPTLGKHPSGRGMTLLYPDEVVERCRRVLKFQKAGRTFDEIRYMVLFPEVETVLDRPKGKPVDLESLFLAFVVDYSAKLIPDESLRHTLMIALKKGKVLEQARQLLEASNNPVLAFHPARAIVCPDFMVSQMLADIPKGDQFPFIHLPLLPPLAAAHKAMGLPAPPIPQKTPAKLVHYFREDDGSFALYEFVNMGQGRHEIRLTPLETRPVGEKS